MAKRIMGLSMVFALIIVVSVSLAACGGGSNGTVTENRVKPYDRDGMLGTTNSNPNLPTSPTYHTYGKDRKLVEDTLATFPEISNPRVSFNGATITIRYREPEGYTEEQSKKLREDLAAALRYMLPRYDFRLESDRRP